MRVFAVRFGVILAIAVLVMGGVRKKEDPVAATAQTGPISLKQKLEEEKDGVKGAPTPSMTFYGHNKFLTTSAVDNKKQEEPTAEEKEDSSSAGWEPEFEMGQETPEKAVEDEESWWSEGEEDSFSDTAPSKPGS